jgi:D-alanyl-D-alanine carboxypeptidase (penicillin-binding protein 5/6)
LSVYVSDELKKEINILAGEDIERLNIFLRIFKSLNYLVWGDA